MRFTHKDYRADPTQSLKTMTLAATEFIRRFDDSLTLLDVISWNCAECQIPTSASGCGRQGPDHDSVDAFSGVTRRILTLRVRLGVLRDAQKTMIAGTERLSSRASRSSAVGSPPPRP